MSTNHADTDRRPNGLPSGVAGRSDGRRIALYSHDTMGVGHVRRNLLIAQMLARPPLSATVLLIAGAREASAFLMPPGVDCVTLPSLYKSSNGQYRSRALDLATDHLIDLRAQTIRSALNAFAPDLFIVDKEPRGALGELGPTLEDLRANGRTRCVLGLRDVLDDPATVCREWTLAKSESAIREYYDAVWVYGDPAVYDVARECRFDPEIRAKLAYTGYLNACDRLVRHPAVGRPAQPELPPRPYVLCMVGGGQDGAALAEAFAAAPLPPGRTGVVITGPCMPAEARERLHRRAATDSKLRVLEFIAEPCRLVRGAERVVTMGGYNSVCEVVAFGKPALVVPRVSPRREQLIRAERLRDLGFLDVLHPDDVGADTIADWLARPSSPKSSAPIDLKGNERLPGLAQAVLDGNPVSTRSRPVEVQHVAL